MAFLFSYLDMVLFAALPYLVLFTFLLVSIQRYRLQTFSFSSLSSQLLENRRHFWALVPFHYGILVVFAGHLMAFLIPRSILFWNSHPLRLYVLEVTGLAFGILTLVGLLGMVARRLGNSKLRVVTSRADAVLYVLLLLQVVSGVAVAVFQPWGSSWFATSLAPYLWSLFRFQPDLTYITGLPILIKLHILNAFIVVGLFPFTRLVHILVVPNPYLWRKPQVVRWYGPAPRDIA
ncbi:MAG: respiratory nitrate reductase subunit gamma [Candidatus Hydrogenedentes bacterium]|nr:respiratory nitrate reductase subunit gamma [Candidatus Hydrogenedentota bacterium]MBI3119051.1 respiratory nitrate reductase subunit gamma [Candidatus Hydrogenedentota bacterium]